MAKYKNYIRASLVMLAVFISYQWLSYFLAGEAGRVRRFVLQGKRAIESKNIFRCADMISINYKDKYGNDRSSLLYATKEGFSYYLKIFINIEEMDIELSESKKEATAKITALVIGQPKDKIAEKIMEGDKGKFQLKLIKEDDKWKLAEIEFYESVTMMGHEVS